MASGETKKRLSIEANPEGLKRIKEEINKTFSKDNLTNFNTGLKQSLSVLKGLSIELERVNRQFAHFGNHAQKLGALTQQMERVAGFGGQMSAPQGNGGGGSQGAKSSRGRAPLSGAGAARAGFGLGRGGGFISMLPKLAAMASGATIGSAGLLSSAVVAGAGAYMATKAVGTGFSAVDPYLDYNKSLLESNDVIGGRRGLAAKGGSAFNFKLGSAARARVVANTRSGVAGYIGADASAMAQANAQAPAIKAAVMSSPMMADMRMERVLSDHTKAIDKRASVISKDLVDAALVGGSREQRMGVGLTKDLAEKAVRSNLSPLDTMLKTGESLGFRRTETLGMVSSFGRITGARESTNKFKGQFVGQFENAMQAQRMGIDVGTSGRFTNINRRIGTNKDIGAIYAEAIKKGFNESEAKMLLTQMVSQGEQLERSGLKLDYSAQVVGTKTLSNMMGLGPESSARANLYRQGLTSNIQGIGFSGPKTGSDSLMMMSMNGGRIPTNPDEYINTLFKMQTIQGDKTGLADKAMFDLLKNFGGMFGGVAPKHGGAFATQKLFKRATKFDISPKDAQSLFEQVQSGNFEQFQATKSSAESLAKKKADLGPSEKALSVQVRLATQAGKELDLGKLFAPSVLTLKDASLGFAETLNTRVAGKLDAFAGAMDSGAKITEKSFKKMEDKFDEFGNFVTNLLDNFSSTLQSYER